DECASDAEVRAARREQDAVRRREQDKQLVADMTQVIREMYPGCPSEEAHAIAAHTAQRGSGRVGRSAAGREISPQAVSLAVAAWVRHQHTEYDTLLMHGVERFDARAQIAETARGVLARWENPLTHPDRSPNDGIHRA
ncbi:MAG: DUF2293 domain-containing protein, partial [Planctomycetia bacterium]|nr:DUF2293 domain-containing protein [Planctomycetia bacterium]